MALHSFLQARGLALAPAVSVMMVTAEEPVSAGPIPRSVSIPWTWHSPRARLTRPLSSVLVWGTVFAVSASVTIIPRASDNTAKSVW